MPPADYAAYLQSLGWLAALTSAALAPSLPGMPGRRHAGWLIAFCATRLLVATQAFVLPLARDEWRAFAAVVSGMLLWEFARRVWNDSHPRRISVASHLVAVECLVLAFVTGAPAAGVRPAWVLPIDLLLTTLPVLLGGATVWLVWSEFARPVPRLAAIGLGLFGLAGTAPGLLAPWLAAGALGALSFAHPAARTRPALGCAAGLALTALVGPLAVAASLAQIDDDARDDLLARVSRAVAPLQGHFAARLREVPLGPDTRRALHEHLENLRTADPLLHTARFWQLRGDRIWMLDPVSADFVDRRAATADEPLRASGLRPFIAPTDESDRAVTTIHAPLCADRFETPVAWLALDYPATFWTVQRQHARRTGAALIGAFAAFCAMGFVLATRQAIENAQHLAIERAQSADQAKTEFLAFLSHEMRTPLHTILGRSELVRREAPATARHLEAIETQGRHLLRLVNDLLDLGTIEAGRMQLHPAPFALRALLAALEEVHGPVAAHKGLALDVGVAPDVPDALAGDEMRLRQILGNLLGNAVKYTVRGEVRLEVTTEAGEGPEARLVFWVRDTGPGLPPEKIPQLFTLFTRLDAGDTFTREGTGVGLALVRRLCALMGGTVSAANRPEGGAEFTVRLTLPLATNAAAPAAAVGEHVSGAGLAVLLAEDNLGARELVAEALRALGHIVEPVADGPSVLAAAATRRFDAFVLDINLPGLDGVEIARRLRGQHTSARIVGCSAEAQPAVRDAALAAGFDAFLVKPVALDVLARAIGHAPEASAAANLFERLHSPTGTAHTRALLAREWPRLRAETEAAVAGGDGAALRRLAHYLQSSALLLADPALLGLCRRLSAFPAAAGGDNPRASLDEIEHHFAAWSVLPASPSSATTPPT